MRYPSPGKHKDLASFRAHLRSVAPELDVDEVVEGASGPLGTPFELGGRRVGNRFAIHPMEGWDGTPEGLPSEHTRRRWRHFGASGAKLIWGGEAFAVQADGRANPGQLFLNPGADVAGALASLRAELVAAHRAAGGSTDDLLIGLQLTHSGRFARPAGEPEPRIAYHDPALDAKLGIDPGLALVSDGELESIGASFVRAAELAARAGFDFVDVKCCHGYLMHELLGARSRPGAYGGSFANRTRFLRRVIAAIRAACPSLEVGVRVSIADVCPFEKDAETGVGRPLALALPYRHGFGIDAADPLAFDWAEPRLLLDLLCEQGIRLVNVSLGSPYCSPHLQRPAAYPPSDGYAPPEDPLASVARHLRAVRACKAHAPGLVLVGSGYTYLQEWLAHVAQHELRAGHVDFVGLGRMVLAHPQFPRDVLAGRPLARKKLCRTFSDCTTGPRNGMLSGCFPLDPYYRALPEGERVRAIRGAFARGDAR